MLPKALFLSTIEKIRQQEARIDEFDKALSKMCDGFPAFDKDNLYLLALRDLLKYTMQDQYDNIGWWLYEAPDAGYTVSWEEAGKEVSVDLTEAGALYVKKSGCEFLIYKQNASNARRIERAPAGLTPAGARCGYSGGAAPLLQDLPLDLGQTALRQAAQAVDGVGPGRLAVHLQVFGKIGLQQGAGGIEAVGLPDAPLRQPDLAVVSLLCQPLGGQHAQHVDHAGRRHLQAAGNVHRAHRGAIVAELIDGQQIADRGLRNSHVPLPPRPLARSGGG